MHHSVQVLTAGHIILTPPAILPNPSFESNHIAYFSVRFTVLFACVFSQDMLHADTSGLLQAKDAPLWSTRLMRLQQLPG